MKDLQTIEVQNLYIYIYIYVDYLRKGSAVLRFFILALINQALTGQLQTLYPEMSLNLFCWLRRTI